MARRVRTSQKDRLTRLRAEKAAKATPAKKAAAKKKAASGKKGAAAKKSAAKKTSAKKTAAKKTSRARAAKKTGRKVIVWAVYDSAFRVIETFPFKQQVQAEKLARKLTREKKKSFIARKLKQDM